MKIQWLGHSCFKLTESTGTTIVTDPYNSYVGFSMPQVSADVVTVSHKHKDHSAVENVQGNPQVIDSVGAWEIGGVGITALQSYHDNDKGAKRGENTIYLYRMDGIDICHMGDIGQELSVNLGESIGSVNVLMIPVGGNYTIDAEQAKEYVDFLMPDIVIPMHYKTENSELDVDGVDGFIDLFDEDQIVYVDGETLELDREKFEGDSTKVYVFSDKKF